MELENFSLTGESLAVLKFPASMLMQKTKPVEIFDSELLGLVHKMALTMYREPGCGLAANQVGVDKSIFIADTECSFMSDETSGEMIPINMKPLVFINPKITKNGKEVEYEEGCLSFPNIWVNIKRSDKVRIQFQGLNGESHEYEASGQFADCLQHENDHLEGITFLDRLSPLKRKMTIKKYLKSNT